MSTDQKTKDFTSAAKILGDCLTLQIAKALSNKSMRFCELQRAVGNANPVTLTSRLKRLEKEKIVVRKEETIDRQSVSYALTNKGKQVAPIVLAIEHFAQS